MTENQTFLSRSDLKKVQGFSEGEQKLILNYRKLTDLERRAMSAAIGQMAQRNITP